MIPARPPEGARSIPDEQGKPQGQGRGAAGSGSHDEAAAVRRRYARRQDGDRYAMTRPEVWQTVQERQRLMLRALAGAGDPARLRLIEVGCGDGGNLLEWLRAGLAPAHLAGLELLPERFEQARERLPAATWLWKGDALLAPVEPGSQDLVLQSTVFSSLLDAAFQQRLADTMWRWLRPGGAVLWYDLGVDNPRNADVRGVPVSRIRALFPEGRVQARRVTLAPPLARAVCRVHPALYTLFNALPLLRTHRLALITKPIQPSKPD